ncbi:MULTISPECIES: hypothetical protein [Liquorilactobacillus]|uniref:hypothetical protein n=1 Tax=Liquorilactobacillus TaxID=2767888 RepID=UPI001CBF5E45|nr:hypothetical protein [Liquorilactobacillus hordei]MBZ2406644.1 hypothetical protein [Liquorilactobacillus hordei]
MTLKDDFSKLRHPIQTKNEYKEKFNQQILKEQEHIKNKQKKEEPISDYAPLIKVGGIFMAAVVALFFVFWFTNQFMDAFPKLSIFVPILIVLVVLAPFIFVIFKKIKELRK